MSAARPCARVQCPRVTSTVTAFGHGIRRGGSEGDGDRAGDGVDQGNCRQYGTAGSTDAATSTGLVGPQGEGDSLISGGSQGEAVGVGHLAYRDMRGYAVHRSAGNDDGWGIGGEVHNGLIERYDDGGPTRRTDMEA